MPNAGKFKSFWKWLKYVLAIAVLWPVLSTLAYIWLPVPVTNLMIFRLLGGQRLNKNWIPLQAISPNLPRAVVASEDQRFCIHHGIDWVEFHDATAGAEGPSRGASTISMQVAKNLYLWEGHSFIRKGLEMPLAVYMDAVLRKRRMMEIYLNVVEWAPGVYGAEAAAQHHFGKPAAKLTMHEAALLAASLPNPFKRDAGHPSAALRAIASDIEDQMQQMGPYLTCLD